MTFVDEIKQTFDAGDFCETIKSGVGEGRITSNIALRDSAAVATAIKYLQDFAKFSTVPLGPDVIAAYVTYSPGAPEMFNALRAVSVNIELVSAALECLTCIVKYSLDGTKPQQPLEQARSVVKEMVKSRAVLIYDVLATEGKACAKKALNLLRLVASCHPMLAKELVNRFDLSAKSMAPSLCSVKNNHCRVPFLDLLFVILASGERDVLHYLSGKGREVIVTCLRTIQERATLEADGGIGSATKSIRWKQGKAHDKKPPKVLPSHVQKRELVAAINFLLALEKHVFVGFGKSSRGGLSHPVPTILAALAATEIPPIEVAPTEVLQEHEDLRSTASRMFISIARDSRSSASVDITRALNNPSFNFGTKAVVKFVSHVIQEVPELATHLLKAGRVLAAPPALTLRWFGYVSVIATCILRLPSPITTFREKQFFEKCLNHKDPLIRHLGIILAISFCKVMEKSTSPEQRADDYLPALEVVQKMLKPGANDSDLTHRLIASYQSLLRKHDVGTDVKLMVVSVDAAGDDIMTAARTIEGALRTAPYSAVRKVVHKRYLSKLITRASKAPRSHDALKLWSVCGRALRCTDLFQPGTDAEIDIYLSVLSSLGKEADEPAKAFEAIIAQALEMPYGLYDRLHSEEWSEESAAIKTSQMTVAVTIKLQKLTQKLATKGGSDSDHLLANTLKLMVLSVFAAFSLLHGEGKPNSYLTMSLPHVLKAADIWWDRRETEEENTYGLSNSRRMVGKLLNNRGTYPKTKFLRLIEALISFEESGDIKSRNDIPPRMMSKLELTWDSWCEYWLSNGIKSRNITSSNVTKTDERSKETTDFIFRGVTRLLLFACYNRKVAAGMENDLKDLKKILRSRDYLFATAMMLRTVENESLREKLYEDSLLQMSDIVSHQTVRPEESEFLYEAVLRSVTNRSNWNTSQVNKVLAFCVSVISRWASLPGWEIHVAYSIALMKTLLSHFSIRVAVCARAFLATQTVDSLPPLTKLTDGTINNLLTVLEYSPCFHNLAIAQVYDWSEKEHRSCSSALLHLLSTALTVNSKNKRHGKREKLLETFVKASTKSRTVWVSSGLSEDGRKNLGALTSIARMISQARKPCELFLCRFLRAESFSRNSWLLLGSILESSKVGTRPEITSEELARVLSMIVKHIGAFSRLDDEYPEPVCLHVLESVAQHLRERKVSFYALNSSADQDVVNLSKNLSDCLQSRFSILLSNSAAFVNGPYSESSTDSDYIADLLSCHAEILKLDLSLEIAAKAALVNLSINDGQCIRYCLQTDKTAANQDGFFPRRNDIGIQLISVVKAALPWLSHGRCDQDLARALLGIQTVLTSQLGEMTSIRNERHSSTYECVKIVSNYVRANDLQKRFPALLERTVSLETEAARMLNQFPKSLLEGTADYILQTSYHADDMTARTGTCGTENADPVFVLNLFLHGCRQALLQRQAPVLDLHRIAKDGLLALLLTGTASTNQEILTLSFACLEALAALVGPATGVSPGSASGLYKDRRQLAFLLDLLRNSVSDPLTQVLPLFAVWFRTAARIVLSPGHAVNKLITTFLLRAPCLDVSDCYGLSHFLNCEASGSELQSIRLLAFDIITKGVHSQRDVSVIRRRRIFDKAFMFIASPMGFDSAIRIGALKSLEAMLSRDESLDIADELVRGHAIIGWLASDARVIGETTEEVFIKLNIIRSAAESFARRQLQGYASILSEALTLFATSRLKPVMTTGREFQVAERIAECGASIARISPKKRYLFRIDFADLWIQCKSKKGASFKADQDFARCVCRQGDIVTRTDILEMLLAIQENDSKNRRKRGLEPCSDDLSMIHMFIADSLLAMKHKGKKADLITSELSNRLAMSLCVKSSVWLLVAAVTTLDLCGHLKDRVMACTDKIPAFLPQELKPCFEQQFYSTVEEIRLIAVQELLVLGDKLIHSPSKSKYVDSVAESYPTANGTMAPTNLQNDT